MQFIRSLLFSIVMLILTVLVAIIGMLVSPMPIKVRNYFIRYYALSNLVAIKLICNLDYQVIGAENIGKEACIIMSNHQSIWETFAFQAIFPHLCFVVKKELFWVPFFGWALAMLKPIAIDRKAGRNAVQQVVEQGKERLQSGIWVVIFPEGTRTAPGGKSRYKKGGAVLAQASGFDVVPVAHNAGKFWPKKGFLKKSGTISVVIGEKITSKAHTTDEIANKVESWIESTKQTLD